MYTVLGFLNEKDKLCFACWSGDGVRSSEEASTYTHNVSGTDGVRSVANRVNALGSSYVVMGMACSAVEGAIVQANAICKRAQLVNTVCRQVKPDSTVLGYICIVDVYQLVLRSINVERALI